MKPTKQQLETMLYRRTAQRDEALSIIDEINQAFTDSNGMQRSGLWPHVRELRARLGNLRQQIEKEPKL